MYSLVPRLPLELCGAIIECAAPDVQRTCRLVSRPWSDLARPVVFRDFVVEFGVHPIGPKDIGGHVYTNQDRANFRAQLARSRDFFDYIKVDESGRLIADKIRSFTVRLLLLGDLVEEDIPGLDRLGESAALALARVGNHTDTITLENILLRGLSGMPKLQAFRWSHLNGEVTLGDTFAFALVNAGIKELSFP